MDAIQRTLIKAGRKDLAKKYYHKVTSNKAYNSLTKALVEAIKKGKPLCFPIIDVTIKNAEGEVTGKNIKFTGNILRVGNWLNDQEKFGNKVDWKLIGFTDDRNEARKRATEV